MIRSQRDLLEAASKALNGTSDETDDLGAFGMYHALSGCAQEVLFQLVKNGPVWDGDLIAKSGRDELLDNGLAVKCCAKGEQGFQVANYVGWNVLMAGTLGAAKAEVKASRESSLPAFLRPQTETSE